MSDHRSLLNKRGTSLCLNLLVTSAILLPAIPVQSQDKKELRKTPGEEDVIKVSSNLVNLDVMVKDKKGKAITDLKLAAASTAEINIPAGGSAAAQAMISRRVLEQYVQLRSALSTQQTRPVLAGLSAICEGLRAIPGKKTLVVFSQGIYRASESRLAGTKHHRHSQSRECGYLYY